MSRVELSSETLDNYRRIADGARFHGYHEFATTFSPWTIISLIEELERLRRQHGVYKRIAESVHGGEIPSPLFGLEAAAKDASAAQLKYLNCPCCDGSGHVDDCDGAMQETLVALDKEADWLAERLKSECEGGRWCPADTNGKVPCPGKGKMCYLNAGDWRKAAQKAVAKAGGK